MELTRIRITRDSLFIQSRRDNGAYVAILSLRTKLVALNVVRFMAIPIAIKLPYIFIFRSALMNRFRIKLVKFYDKEQLYFQIKIELAGNYQVEIKDGII